MIERDEVKVEHEGNVRSKFKWFLTRERERDCHMLRQRDSGKLVILMQV